MTKRTRRTHSAAFKAKVTLAAVEGERTPVEFTEWKGHSPATRDIANSDQGSQFTADASTEAVLGRGVRLSTDDKGGPA